MSIIRGPRPDSNFYVLDKKISEDKRLSWAGRGLLIYLLGKPNHWQVSVQALVNETSASAKPAGRDATWSLLRELMDAGYCTRRQARKADGTLGEMDYIISEDAKFHPCPVEPLTANPCPVQPGTVQPGTANPTQVSIEGKQGLKKKQGLNEEGADAPAPRSKKIIGKPDDVSQKNWNAWLDVRADKNVKSLSQVALDNVQRQAQIAGLTLDEAIEYCVIACWAGFNAAWHAKREGLNATPAATQFGAAGRGFGGSSKYAGAAAAIYDDFDFNSGEVFDENGKQVN